MAGLGQIRKVYGGPTLGKFDVPVTPEMLSQLGECMVKAFSEEAKKDFAKRGWSGRASDGSKPVWESFYYEISGNSTVVVKSTFPRMEEMISGDKKPYRLTWLTQEYKKKHPSKFNVTPFERKRMRMGKKNRNKRMPLVVPLKTARGEVVFRMAPLKMSEAWVHPGIARFTFVERAVKKGKTWCMSVIKQEVAKALAEKLKQGK